MAMERQNVTLSLPKSLLKKAKALAASREKSLSVLLRESLEEKVGSASGFNKARERQVKLLKRGFDLGTKGRLTVSREELHVR
jgi:predicted transcriptional regulator